MKAQQFLILASQNFNQSAQKTLQQAVDFAASAHQGQKRLSGEPYIRHPLAVAAMLIDWGLDRDTIVAALLHDTVEDCGTTLTELEAQFGPTVAFLVDGVTKLNQRHKNDDHADSHLPKTHDNLTKLLIATSQDVRVLIIKLADRLHNLQTLNVFPSDKQQRIAKESLRIYGPLADRLNMGQAKKEIEELAFSYTNPHEYQHLKKELKTRTGAGQKKLEEAQKEVEQALQAEKINYEISGRIKSAYSLYKKLQKNPIERIYDLMAMRILVDTTDDCYRVLGILHRLFIPLEGRVKDYISRPKPNGYQSLHTTVLTYDQKDQEFVMEFQIRTHEMHDFAEHGLAASFHYNEQKLTEAYQKRQIAAMPQNLNWISELQKIASHLSESKAQDSLEKLKIDLFDDLIFVYTPKGDIFELPRGSKPLDFAYRIHSDLADMAVGCRINDKMADFDTILQDSDTVEILTRKGIRPNLGWLQRITTPSARQKVKSALKKDQKLDS